MSDFTIGGYTPQEWAVIHKIVLRDEDKITVCKECKTACCWQGEFMCQRAKGADITEKTVGWLRKNAPTKENEEYWQIDLYTKGIRGEVR